MTNKNELPEIDGHITVTRKDVQTATENSITYEFEHTGGDVIGVSLTMIRDSNFVSFYGDWLIVGTLTLEILGVKYGALVCRLVQNGDDI